MAATATSASTDIRYAPEDPTLPKPWIALVDGSTGYVYFWNPETDVTQYERPVAPSSSSVPSQLSLTSTVQKNSRVKHYIGEDDVDKYTKVSSGGPIKNASASGSYSTARDISNYSNGETSAPRGSYTSNGADSCLSAESFCRQHEITVTGDLVPQPFTTFKATGFPPEILREVQHAGFSVPTPIQAQSWPIALQGRDLVAIAKTGSGKTLGFLFPGFSHLKKSGNNPKLGPTVLLLAPTRELATQILDEAVKFGRSSKISCTCLYGGASMGPQLRDLARGVDIVVATPGRLNDILTKKKVSLHQVSYLVLDEADRMLDMGFEPQIRKIVNEVPSRRQTLMFTATWPKEVRKIAGDLLVNPVQVNIGGVNELVANNAITQHVEVLLPMDKRRRVEQIIRSQEAGSKIIVFCSTKRRCEQLAAQLAQQFVAAAIHGDKSQEERNFVLNQFRKGRTPVLVATDVAARGLDIKDIKVVINYDFPSGIENYVHRIGRTGRAGATGVAYTFLCKEDDKHASHLIKVLEGANQHVPVEVHDLALHGSGARKARHWIGSGPGVRNSDHRQRERNGLKSSDVRDTSGNHPLNNSPHANKRADENKRGRSRNRSPNWKSRWSHGRSRSRSMERFSGAPAPT